MEGSATKTHSPSRRTEKRHTRETEETQMMRIVDLKLAEEGWYGSKFWYMVE